MLRSGSGNGGESSDFDFSTQLNPYSAIPPLAANRITPHAAGLLPKEGGFFPRIHCRENL